MVSRRCSLKMHYLSALYSDVLSTVSLVLSLPSSDREDWGFAQKDSYQRWRTIGIMNALDVMFWNQDLGGPFFCEVGSFRGLRESLYPTARYCLGLWLATR